MALFVHVVERGGFTAAARYLNQPLSTVSRRIADLEEHIGVRLLERSTRSVRLTELGESYYEYCRRGVQEFDNANLMIENRQTDMSGLLRITAPPNLVAPFFVPVVLSFQALHPNARVLIATTERRVDLLHDGIDMAFRVGGVKDSRLTSRRIAQYRHRLIASPAYLEEHGTPTHPDHLAEHRTIAFASGNAPVQWHIERCNEKQSKRPASVPVDPHFMMNDYQAIMAAVEQGGGIAEVPETLCATEFLEKRLIEPMPEWQFATVTLSVLHLGIRNMPRLARLFVDHCVSDLPPMMKAAKVSRS